MLWEREGLRFVPQVPHHLLGRILSKIGSSTDLELLQVLWRYLGKQFLLLHDVGLLSLAVHPSLPSWLSLPLNLASRSIIEPLYPLLLTTTPNLLAHVPLALQGIPTAPLVQVGVQPVLLGYGYERLDVLVREAVVLSGGPKLGVVRVLWGRLGQGVGTHDDRELRLVA